MAARLGSVLNLRINAIAHIALGYHKIVTGLKIHPELSDPISARMI
jgi:hypothetical protein